MKLFLNWIIGGVILVTIGVLSSCQKDLLSATDAAQAEQLAIDDSIILSYLQAHSLTAQKDNSGLYYIITEEGNGKYPGSNSLVKVNYKGYLTDGTVFEDTKGSPANFYINQLIEGWKIGIPLVSEGGKITLFIPSYLGYGNYKVGNIPANSVLIFEIELVKVD